MITIAKLLSLIGLYTSALPDDHDLKVKLRRVEIAAQHHDRISAQVTASALNIFTEQETDTRLAQTLRDAKSMEETVDAIVREMQGRR